MLKLPKVVAEHYETEKLEVERFTMIYPNNTLIVYAFRKPEKGQPISESFEDTWGARSEKLWLMLFQEKAETTFKKKVDKTVIKKRPCQNDKTLAEFGYVMSDD
jgi:hypothetical protein